MLLSRGDDDLFLPNVCTTCGISHVLILTGACGFRVHVVSGCMWFQGACEYSNHPYVMTQVKIRNTLHIQMHTIRPMDTSCFFTSFVIIIVRGKEVHFIAMKDILLNSTTVTPQSHQAIV